MKSFLDLFSDTDVRNIIAVLYIVLVLFFIYVLAFVPIPEANKDLVNVLGGTVIGGSGMILSFYFGASKATGAK
jgi:hypothetical protein